MRMSTVTTSAAPWPQFLLTTSEATEVDRATTCQGTVPTTPMFSAT